jgi:3-phosphoshikimate 1-carboxyvinyltransferase
LKVKVKPSKLQGNLTAPPSKSYTHRAILLASLCTESSTITNPLVSRDTQATIDACQALGASISSRSNIMSVKGRLPLMVPSNVVNVENSGTTLRLITSAAALSEKGYTVITGDESVRQRPMQPLLDALHAVGVRSWSLRLNGCAPVIVEGGGIHGGNVTMPGDISSQFISSLLISAAIAKSETVVQINGKLVSRPYLDATLKIISLFGGNVNETPIGVFRIPERQRYTPTVFRVPGDFSSISFALAGGALSGGEVSVDGLDFSLPQGDAVIVNILEKMGADVFVDTERGRVKVKGGNSLCGGKFDLSDTPDLLPVVAVLGCRSEGEVLISGVKHARFKETDRIAVLAEELPKLGAQVEELDDGLRIMGKRRFKTCTLNSHNDHRMAMIFAIAGFASEEGCVIDGLESVDVSYPTFREDIQAIGGKIEAVE